MSKYAYILYIKQKLNEKQKFNLLVKGLHLLLKKPIESKEKKMWRSIEQCKYPICMQYNSLLGYQLTKQNVCLWTRGFA